MQAYADDLLVFGDTREHLNILVEGLIQFMEYAHISFNPKKYKILIHNTEKITVQPLFLPDASNIEQEMEVCNIRDTIKYRGAPLSTRRLQKMKFNKCRIEKRRRFWKDLETVDLKSPNN
jgi:hypothetical protein